MLRIQEKEPMIKPYRLLESDMICQYYTVRYVQSQHPCRKSYIHVETIPTVHTFCIIGKRSTENEEH